MTPNTHAVYNNALSAFGSFRQKYNFSVVWPVPVPHLTLFIAYCFEQGYSPATVSSYMSGISFYHKISSLQDSTSNFVFKKLLEGFKRTRKRRDVRAPITEGILQKICITLNQVCYNEYEYYLFKAAYLLAYFGLLRISELVFTSHLMSNRPLMCNDIQLVEGDSAVLITIRISKTNQRGLPCTLRIPATDNPLFCCVTAVQSYLKYRPHNAPYFLVHRDGAPLTRGQFCSVLAKTLHFLRLPTSIYTSHSFRIGRATDLASKGVLTSNIQKLGRWSTNTVERYIRM